MDMQKTAVIAGGSGGIGSACAKLFLSKGYRVYNMSRTDCRVSGVINIRLDLTAPETVEIAAERFLTDSGGLDVLINSAGFSMAAPAENAAENDFRHLFEVNFFGAFRLIRPLLPALKKRRGIIINIGSTAAVLPIAYDSFYSASKAALNMLTLGLRSELARFGVRACAVLPGGTRTPFTYNRKVYRKDEVDPAYEKDLAAAAESLAHIEQGGDRPEKVAKTVYSVCMRKKPPPVTAAGLSNKALVFFAGIMPKRLLLYITGKVFRQ